MSPGWLAAVLLIVLLATGAAFMWQERRGSGDSVVVYGVEDSIDFIFERLSPDTRERLRKSDVRRILEWEVRYLQDDGVRDGSGPPVAGSHESAVYVQRRALDAGYSYDGPLILEVLELQGHYFAAIGAVGEPVAGEDVADWDVGEATEEMR